MADTLRFGIQTDGIKHAYEDPMPDIDTRFRMVRDAGVFDYVDKTPEPHEVDDFDRASETYAIPVLAGGWYYDLGAHEALLETNLALPHRLGSKVHNVQIRSFAGDGSVVTDTQVVETFIWAYDLGEKYGVLPCFEVHVNTWSEDLRRVAKVGCAVQARVVPYCMTLDHSHVIFEMDDPEEQGVQGMRAAVESGEVVLDPFQAGNVIEEWVSAGWIRHCHARVAVANNPNDTPGRHPDGAVGRGIQYPFKKPGPGEYHADWREEALEPWKEAMRHLLRQHAGDAEGHLGQIFPGFILNRDYRMGARYSLFEQAVACVDWVCSEWNRALTEPRSPIVP